MELAQYRELESFSLFGSELDKVRSAGWEHGKRIVEILKQPQYKPMPVAHQVLILYAVTNRYLMDIPVERILEFEDAFLRYMEEHHPEVPASINQEKVLTPEMETRLKDAIQAL